VNLATLILALVLVARGLVLHGRHVVGQRVVAACLGAALACGGVHRADVLRNQPGPVSSVTAVLSSTALATEWSEWDRAPRTAASVRWGMPWVEAALGDSPMPGSTVVIGADSNVGKTFFTLELLRALAGSGNVVLLALEDPPLELGRRMAQAGYAHQNLHVAFPDPGNVLRAFDEVAGGALKPVAVAIDYAQCVADDMDGLNAFIRGLRSRTLAHGCVSVLGSQINTLPPGTEEHGVPGISRLKGTRKLKEAADTIFMMANGRERQLVVEIGKAKGAQVGARARYRRGEGGRLVQLTTKLDEDDDNG
jgi:hypothetical protein